MIVLIYGKIGVMPEPDPKAVTYSPVKEKGVIHCPTVKNLRDIIAEDDFDASTPIYIKHIHQMVNNGMAISPSPYDVKDDLTFLMNKIQQVGVETTIYSLEHRANQGEYIGSDGLAVARGLYQPALPMMMQGIIETYAHGVWRYHQDRGGETIVDTEPTEVSDTFTSEREMPEEDEPTSEEIPKEKDEQEDTSTPVITEEKKGEMDREMAKELYNNEYNFNNINDAKWIFDNIRTEGLREKISKSSKYNSKDQQKVLEFYDILRKNIVGKQ